MSRLTRMACLPLVLLIECWLVAVFIGCCVYAVWCYLTKGLSHG